MDQQVAVVRPTAQHRVASPEIPHDSDRYHDGLPAGQVPAHHPDAEGGAGPPQAPGQVGHPGHRGVPGQHQADHQGHGDRPHGGDVGEVLGGGPSPHLLGAHPVGTEVAALDQHVGAHAVAPVRGGQDRAVVPDAHQGRRAGRQQRGQGGQEPGLTQVRDGPPGGGRLSG